MHWSNNNNFNVYLANTGRGTECKQEGNVEAGEGKGREKQ